MYIYIKNICSTWLLLINIEYSFLMAELFFFYSRARFRLKHRRTMKRRREKKAKESQFVSSASFHPISVQRLETAHCCVPPRPPNRLWAAAAAAVFYIHSRADGQRVRTATTSPQPRQRWFRWGDRIEEGGEKRQNKKEKRVFGSTGSLFFQWKTKIIDKWKIDSCLYRSALTALSSFSLSAEEHRRLPGRKRQSAVCRVAAL